MQAVSDPRHLRMCGAMLCAAGCSAMLCGAVCFRQAILECCESLLDYSLLLSDLKFAVGRGDASGRDHYFVPTS